MADHGEVEYATATGNDYAAHEQTYRTFIHLVKGVLAVVVVILISDGHFPRLSGRWRAVCGGPGNQRGNLSTRPRGMQPSEESMKVAVAAEVEAGEPRVAATPETIKKIIGLGAEVAVEPGAGIKSGILDADYAAAGAEGLPAMRSRAPISSSRCGGRRRRNSRAINAARS